MSWYAWGDEPFARAQREGKLVLLSIGYSTCHWCHVMEAESFEDEEVARYVNANYICIKVDREERPDLDALYMQALVAMTGSGGWPMTIVADARSPPGVRRHVHAARPQLLGDARAAPRDGSRAARRRRARDSTQALAHDDRATRVRPALPGPDAIVRGARALAARFDPQYGGFGARPQVPERARPRAAAALPPPHRATRARSSMVDAHARRDGGRRHPRSARRRLPSLRDRSPVARAALREDAVRQRAARDRLHRGRAGHRPRRLRARSRARRSTTCCARWPRPTAASTPRPTPTAPAPDGTMRRGHVLHVDARRRSTPRSVPSRRAPPRRYRSTASRSCGDGRRSARAHVIARQPPLDARRARATLLAARAQRTPPRARRQDPRVVERPRDLGAREGGLRVRSRRRTSRAAERAATFVLGDAARRDGGLLRSFVGGEARQRGDARRLRVRDRRAARSVRGRRRSRAGSTSALALAGELERRFADARRRLLRDRCAGEQLLDARRSRSTMAPSRRATRSRSRDLLRLGELTGDDAWRTRAEHALAAFDLARDGGSPGLRARARSGARRSPAEIAIVAPHDLAAAAPLVAEVRKAYQPDRTLVVTTDAAPRSRSPPLTEASTRSAASRPRSSARHARASSRPRIPRCSRRSSHASRPLLPDRSPAPLVIPPR